MMLMDQPQTAAQTMYQAAGVVTRELALAIDALGALAAGDTPVSVVPAVADAALARIRRAYDAAAWVRETYG